MKKNKLKVGDKVKHSDYGVGEITYISTMIPYVELGLDNEYNDPDSGIRTMVIVPIDEVEKI